VACAPRLSVRLGELARIPQGRADYPFRPSMEPGFQESRHFRADALAYANARHASEVALWERMEYDDDGQPLSTSFAEYLMQTATCFPMFQTIFQGRPHRRSTRSAPRARAKSAPFAPLRLPCVRSRTRCGPMGRASRAFR
jgi:hypothetical protein